MSKTTKTAKATLSAKQQGLIDAAAAIGYGLSEGFDNAVDMARQLVPGNFLTFAYDADNKATERGKVYLQGVVRDFGIQFRAGHLLRYLERRGYEKRLHNQDRPQRLVSMIAILAKGEPESDKPEVRTDLEQSGAKAANNAWTRVKEASGIKPTRSQTARKPKQGSNKSDKPSDPTPISLAAMPTPKLSDRSAVLAFYDAESKKALQAVNANASAVPPQISSVVSDYRKAMLAAIKEVKALPVATANGPRKPKAAAAK